MGKKKKGGGKKGKKGKKKSGKGGGEENMTLREAILAFQIEVKNKAVEEFVAEINGLEDKNRRHKERNNRLKDEQALHIRTLLKQAKERDKELEQETVVGREKVDSTMKDKWKAIRNEDKSVEDLKTEIEEREKELADQTKVVEYWRKYRDEGQHEHAKQIRLLEQELQDMQVNFDEMASHLQRSLDLAKEKISNYMDLTLQQQRENASERAMTHLDKHSAQEVKDNDWLKHEAELHREEVRTLRKFVEVLEKENLTILSQLFECRIEDLKISRNFYLTQFSDSDALDDQTGMLEMDLAQLAIGKTPVDKLRPDYGSESTSSAGSDRRSRPRSAVVRAVEERVFAIKARGEEGESDSSEEEEEEGEEVFAEHTDGRDMDVLDNYLFFEEEDFEDYLQLGPLELKLLNVTGTKKPLHRPAKPSQEDIASGLTATPASQKRWPVTQEMMQTVLSE
ncbi:PREDICTED: coiled-coil domain-containing protein 83-like [Branchiostoma belcheri]|uniref:Coiled-coil domain-containing protein 83-like n=1 Tax=Branchiostoma belcheri TaxID=7741 RepID=A0A6P4ZUN0_BRABE|nr:PREDICTED: coiled-coil domain-containing protein 83-like [Branchiostoma belcheri]